MRGFPFHVTVALTLCSVLLFGCRKEGDVLAVYGSRKITRGVFYNWLEGRQEARDAILASKSEQKIMLKKLALEMIAIDEAKRTGYDKSDINQFLSPLIKRNFYAGYLAETIGKKCQFDEEVARVRQIMLGHWEDSTGNHGRAITEKEVGKNFDLAIAILGELERGASFEDCARKYSHDPSKKRGGDIGYISTGMEGQDFIHAIFSLNEGEHSPVPVRLKNVVYLFKVEKRVRVTDFSIEHVIEDEDQREKLRNRLCAHAVKMMEKKLALSEDVIDNTNAAANNAAPGALIFRVGTREFRAADLNRVLKLVYLMHGDTRTLAVTSAVRTDWARRLFIEELFFREALRSGIDKEEKFSKTSMVNESYSLAKGYMNYVVLSSVTVTDTELLNEYHKSAALAMRAAGGITGSKMPPFHLVKDNMRQMILSRKRMLKKQEWDATMLKSSDFRIIESELSGD